MTGLTALGVMTGLTALMMKDWAHRINDERLGYTGLYPTLGYTGLYPTLGYTLPVHPWVGSLPAHRHRW